MSRLVVIHQPDFLPWLGFFHRLLRADLYIALDHVQFVSGTSRSWMHRDLIKTRAGPKWLSLSLQKPSLGTAMNEVLLAPDTGWRQTNLNLLRESYKSTPFFGQIYPAIEALYASSHARMVDLNLASLDMLGDFLDVRPHRALSSQMEPHGKNNAMLVSLLRKAGATHYLSGLGARAYLDPTLFAAAGIEVVWQDFVHPSYPQLHGAFEPGLSAIDLLFNCGIAHAREILKAR